MISNIREQEARRISIIDGINNGIPCSRIAAKLGVHLWVVMGDIRRMRHDRDPALKEAYRMAEERVQIEKRKVANKQDERFHMMAGMSLKEKTFSNMMSFYRPELMKILRSENECEAIRKLPESVKRTLKNNGIIAQGWRTPEITALARTHLTRVKSLNS